MSDFWSQFTPASQADDGQTPGITLYPAPYKQVLSITGPDSSKFMQGQFTCNLNDINGQQYRRGAMCNAKGRMVASFDLASHGEAFLMGIDGSLAQVAMNHLKKYMVFFKCKMQASNYVVAGINGPDAHAFIEQHFAQIADDDFAQIELEHGLIIKLPFNGGYEIWIDEQHAQSMLEPLLSKCTLSTENNWKANLITSGLAQLDVNQTENLIPQMMNLGQTGGISFNKGCYTGQEIVARMQYLGKLKRHAYILQIEDPSLQLTSGQEIFTAQHKSAIGSIINVAKAANGLVAIAVLEDKFKDAPLSFESDGPVVSSHLLELPYSLEEAQE